MITKKCYYCGLEKSLEELKKDKRYSHGRIPECKNCHNKKHSEYAKLNRRKEWSRLKLWRDKNKKHVNAQALQYQQTTHGKILKSVHDKVYNAVKTGKLKRQSCEICGEKAHAHHDNYNFPLKVNWLCRTHHAERHQKLIK
jgi:hypothetical protein